MYYWYKYAVRSAGILNSYIRVPIFQHRIVFSSELMSKTVPSTNFGKAYASPHYPSGYKTMTDSFSDYERNIDTVTNYGNHYTNAVFFDNLNYPFMTSQNCDEGITFIATGGSWSSYPHSDSSELRLVGNVDITVKIYGAY